MAAVKKNFIIEQKATFKKRLTYRDKQKRPINLTGFSAKMQIRDATGTQIADLSTTNGKIVLGGAAGTIDLLLTAAETALMTFASALYDLKLVAPDTSETRMLEGKVTLSVGQTV